MLQFRAVYPTTLQLLQKLMSMTELKDFFLVGGTALALQLGHRISVALHFFNQNDFDEELILSALNSNFKTNNISVQKNALHLEINYPDDSNVFVKIDIVKYSYPLIKPIVNIENIRLLSIEDIIPMKLSAIAGRGYKRDFFDIYSLLEKYTLKDMFNLFDKKFQNTNHLHILKSLTYFDDADYEPAPLSLGDFEWSKIKQTFEAEVKRYIQNNN